jgi:hypothetical protein
MKVRILSVLAVSFLLAADAPKEPEVPAWNRKVLAFARDHLGKKVGDGECATLAVRVLEEAKARRFHTSRDGEYVWGELIRTVTPEKKQPGDVLPGDILQFRDAVLVRKVGRTTSEYTYPHHTAIVEAVKSDGKILELLHQNAGDFDASAEMRRKVQRASLSLTDLKKGFIKVYRPQPPEGDNKG